VPDRLEDRVREAQEQQLRDAELAEVVVDPVELALVEVLVHLGRERARRLQVVPERLLDDDARVPGQAHVREPLDDGAEQERRDLEVEDRAASVLQPRREVLERGGIREVARQVRQARGEPVEDRLVEPLARCHDRLAGALAQVVDRPVVHRHADDRAGQQPARLQSIERMEGHHLRQVSRDAEHHEHVGGRARAACPDVSARFHCGGHAPIVRPDSPPVITPSG
jgi:hypothetical protein